MAVEVPLQNGAVNAHQKFNIQLGDNLLDFEVNYVGSYTGAPGWSMDISRDGSKLVSGAMLVPGCDVIANYNAGIGLLIFVGEDPTLDNLGTANHLCWVAE